MRAVALSTRLNRFAADVRSRTEANGLSTTFVVRRCFQVGFGEVVERDHAVPVILEHRHSFRVPRPITLAERLTSFERRGPCRGVDDCAQQFPWPLTARAAAADPGRSSSCDSSTAARRPQATPSSPRPRSPRYRRPSVASALRGLEP